MPINLTQAFVILIVKNKVNVVVVVINKFSDSNRGANNPTEATDTIARCQCSNHRDQYQIYH